jgi:hypothetical protein
MNRRNLYLIFGTILFLCFIFWSAITPGYAMQPLEKPSANTTPVPSTVTKTPVNRGSIAGSPIPGNRKKYEVLAPNKIKVGDILFEATADLSVSDLNFSMKAEYPSSAVLACPILDINYRRARVKITQTPPAGNIHCMDDKNADIYSKVKFQFQDNQAGVDLKEKGSQKGIGSDGSMTRMNKGADYIFTPPLPKDKKVHVTALVELSDFFGIKEPVPFEFDLVAK